MNSDNVLTAYQKASETDSFTMHNEFLKLLLEDVSPSGIERHYTFFNDTDNATLKRILGNGFLKRGQEGLLYLAEKLKTETDKLKRSNVIHLIGFCRTTANTCPSWLRSLPKRTKRCVLKPLLHAAGWAITKPSTYLRLIIHWKPTPSCGHLPFQPCAKYTSDTRKRKTKSWNLSAKILPTKPPTR